MKTGQPFIVFSVYSETNKNNSEAHETVRSFLELQKVKKYIECFGVYKGKRERSFIAPDNYEGRWIAENAAKTYNQESILFVDANGRGKLVFSDGTSKEIGTWRRSYTWENPESYTEHNGKKYVCS